MSSDDNTDHPFDPTNRAYQRFLNVLPEHFEVFSWNRESDGRPVMTTLIDIGSGDSFTVALMDSLEVRDPYVLIAVTNDGALSAYGAFEGATAAANYAPDLVMADTSVVATCPMPLHHPDQAAPPADAWGSVPLPLAEQVRPATATARTAALVLLDRSRAMLTIVGPFIDHSEADNWHPGPDHDWEFDSLIVPLHSAPIDPHRQ
jgi:hypothetical protein